jgi:hypothetical protein
VSRDIPHYTVPEWDGQARHFADVWTLTKGGRVAVCCLWTHPYGLEVRLDVDGELLRSEAGPDSLKLVLLAMDWKDEFME